MTENCWARVNFALRDSIDIYCLKKKKTVICFSLQIKMKFSYMSAGDEFVIRFSFFSLALDNFVAK